MMREIDSNDLDPIMATFTARRYRQGLMQIVKW